MEVPLAEADSIDRVDVLAKQHQFNFKGKRYRLFRQLYYITDTDTRYILISRRD